jgi:hypothetical protein
VPLPPLDVDIGEYVRTLIVEQLREPVPPPENLAARPKQTEAQGW